ncbi:MAG: hypothetical protein RPV21_13940 [Candidatus Sedimenticola sp. (ex Thyasira tokunagai)]
MEPQWWNAKELKRDERFIESSKRGFYNDYDADLSLDETKELYDRYKGNVTTMQKLLCLKLWHLSLPCKKLYDALFTPSQKFSHFRVNITEWESGL